MITLAAPLVTAKMMTFHQVNPSARLHAIGIIKFQKNIHKLCVNSAVKVFSILFCFDIL